jgi:hypothetical protein
MLVYINVAQFHLKFGSLFLQYAYNLCVIIVNFDRLLHIELDGGEEAAPLNNLSCCH